VRRARDQRRRVLCACGWRRLTEQVQRFVANVPDAFPIRIEDLYSPLIVDKYMKNTQYITISNIIAVVEQLIIRYTRMTTHY